MADDETQNPPQFDPLLAAALSHVQSGGSISIQGPPPPGAAAGPQPGAPLAPMGPPRPPASFGEFVANPANAVPISGVLSTQKGQPTPFNMPPPPGPPSPFSPSPNLYPLATPAPAQPSFTQQSPLSGSPDGSVSRPTNGGTSYGPDGGTVMLASMRAPATNATAAIGQSPKWLDHYNPYFAGKAVLIFIDNDISGETWADAVANGGHRFAHQVRMIRLPDLPEKGDVSDWLKTHSVKDLEAVIARSLPWSPPATKIVPRMKPPRSLK